MRKRQFIDLSKRYIKHIVFTYEFLFAVIIVIGVIILSSRLVELYHEPKPRVIAATALTLAEQNEAKLNKLEQKVDAQGKIIPPTVIVEKRVAYEAKPFEDPALRARAQRLRNQQRASNNVSEF